MTGMTRFATTVVGSYPRPVQAADTMKKPTLTEVETDEMVQWAARDQSALGLDVITDGEAYRENMYYFYQKRVDGVTFENMPRLTFGGAGFGIECLDEATHAELAEMPMDKIDKISVRNFDTLRFTGRSRRVNDVRQLVKGY